MDTGLFNLSEAQLHPLWAQELYNFKDHIPETEEYGITSFVYKAREPFDPQKIYSFFMNSKTSSACPGTFTLFQMY